MAVRFQVWRVTRPFFVNCDCPTTSNLFQMFQQSPYKSCIYIIYKFNYVTIIHKYKYNQLLQYQPLPNQHIVSIILVTPLDLKTRRLWKVSWFGGWTEWPLEFSTVPSGNQLMDCELTKTQLEGDQTDAHLQRPWYSPHVLFSGSAGGFFDCPFIILDHSMDLIVENKNYKARIHVYPFGSPLHIQVFKLHHGSHCLGWALKFFFWVYEYIYIYIYKLNEITR